MNMVKHERTIRIACQALLDVCLSSTSLPRDNSIQPAGTRGSHLLESKKRHLHCLYLNSKKKIRHPQKIFFPKKHRAAIPHRVDDGYNRGTFSVHWPSTNKFRHFLSIDHGQFPWGRSPIQGSMAFICSHLNISPSSNVRNTCLALHIIVGVLQNSLVHLKSLITVHKSLLLKYVTSTVCDL